MSRKANIAALAALSCVVALACDATPVTEPPDAVPPVDVGLIQIASPEIAMSTETPRGAEIVAGPGAARAGCRVRATNLDTRDPAVSSSVASDGSFTLQIMANSGAELRLQVVCSDALRSEPVDVQVSETALLPVARLDCLELEPALELVFPALAVEEASSASLRLANHCEADLIVANPRLRLELEDFDLGAVPVEIPRGSTARLEVELAPVANGTREDVLFFEVDAGQGPVRFAISLIATVTP